MGTVAMTRVCSVPGCLTRLSIYNEDSVCAQHASTLAVARDALELLKDILLPWKIEARCADEGIPHDWFFPDESSVNKASNDAVNKLRRARQVCAPCPVKAECLASALRHDDEGIAAGTTKRQRRAVRELDPDVALELLLVQTRNDALFGPYRALNHPSEWREPVAV